MPHILNCQLSTDTDANNTNDDDDNDDNKWWSYRLIFGIAKWAKNNPKPAETIMSLPRLQIAMMIPGPEVLEPNRKSRKRRSTEDAEEENQPHKKTKIVPEEEETEDEEESEESQSLMWVFHRLLKLNVFCS